MCIEDKALYEELDPASMDGEGLAALLLALLKKFGNFAQITRNEIEEMKDAKLGLSVDSEDSEEVRIWVVK